MHREASIARLDDAREPWDVLVVGGGATGLGTAVEAAARGYRTVLLEQADFAQATSSRSTKLVHGGVRYLQRGDLGLVVEGLRERGLLLANAPHLVKNLPFVVPLYDWWEGPFYGTGLKLYDLLAGRLGLGPSRRLSPAETLALVPTVEPAALRGGVVYHDAQFDDARLALALAATLADIGGVPLNYVKVTGLLKEGGRVTGAFARDLETGAERAVRARVVINATGVFADGLRRLDEPGAAPLLSPSQGIHLVLDRSFLPGEAAILVPHTDDGRVLFAVPWQGRTVVGTTDTPLPAGAEPPLEPRPLPQEIEFLLAHARRYLARDPGPEDVLSAFAGLRPLIAAAPPGSRGRRGERGERDTATLTRDHAVLVSPSGLVTIVGGKWTTYRQMGQDAVDRAAAVGGLAERPSITARLHLHGWSREEAGAPWGPYGADWRSLAALVAGRLDLAAPLHPRLPYRAAQVVWAVRQEMARTVEDVLARRTRALLLDARAAAEAAPRTAALMAAELGKDATWASAQTSAFAELARGYLPGW